MQYRAHVHADSDGAFSVKPRTTWEVVRRVARYIKPYPFMALGTIGCAVMAQALALVYPRLTQLIIDDVIDRGQRDLFGPAILGLLGAFVLRDLFNSLRIRLNNVFEQDVIYDIRCEVYSHLERLPAAWFDHRSTGDLMTRVIEDVNAMERLLIDGTEQGVVAILGLAGVAAFLFIGNPHLAWVAAAPIPFLVAGSLTYTLTAHRRYRIRSQASSAMNALLMDNLQGVRQIKLFGREQHEAGRFGEKAGQLRGATLRVMKAWAYYNPAMSLVAASGTVLVLWVGGRLVLDGEMTKGQLVSFLLYLAMFYLPLSQLHGLNQMMQSARAAAERVFDILDAEQEQTVTEAGPLLGERVSGRVQFQQVGLSYETGRWALRNATFEARPGETIALVGPTGAGKTTLVNLLPRFYEATEGQIILDGVDIRKIPLEKLRRQISVVSQEPFLFNGTVRENILYGRLNASDEELMKAAQAANCHEFISALTKGYDTTVGERGVRLSVGEKQRISIARALLKDAPILILDEATASVDTATERLIQEALQRLMSGRTAFVIAHRLSTVRDADCILVLRHGEIVERGTHLQLLEMGGLYAKLHAAQRASAEVEMELP
ncbi:MAG TPA: ABC transporter ATP-binding protein [Candidatus Limnocylindria bacterium]|jgi:ABC-type multidrug transport system fused ATPase/permease subunit|nr:ABC transporter ATP-binding protein [Candidatus Limnocylindria bacterium]